MSIHNLDSLIANLSLEEKVALLCESSMWKTLELPAQVVRSIKVSDGVSGVRGEKMHGSTKTAAFPAAVSMASTFDTNLIHAVGQAICEEAKAKNVDAVLGPSLNLHRSSLWGRHFECFSEDPLLSGLIGAAWVNGLQESGEVLAVPKHFVCNEVEAHRTISNSVVDEKTLREIYLQPFRILLQNADVKALMASYNKLNGIWCSENDELLNGILRAEWGFDGLVMSDWHGTYSTVAAAKVGVDLEMPGPTIHRGEKLLAAVRNGEVLEAEIDEKVCRVLRFSMFARQDSGAPEAVRKDPDTSQLIRQLGADGMVLLKNSPQLLPLKPNQRLAVIGLPAEKPIIKGGGSATVAEEELVSPLDALRVQYPDLIYHPGVHIFKKLPSPSANLLGPSLVSVDWFNGRNFDPIQHLKLETIDQTETHVFDNVDPRLEQDHCIRMSCTITPVRNGIHLIGVTASGLTRVYFDNELVLEFPGFEVMEPSHILDPGTYERRTGVEMHAGRAHSLRVEALSTFATPPPGFRVCPQSVQVGFAEQLPELGDEIEQADAAIVFVGNTKDYESESFDREDIRLSPGQDQLISRVVAKIGGAKTVVVNMTGSPIEMPWIDQVSSCLQAWYPGQQAGNSIADILTGRTNPSGRLPVTFPAQLKDTASFRNFPESDLSHNVHYAEGVFMGYRHYLKEGSPEPQFYFGHGLSYSKFEYDTVSVKQENSGSFVVASKITNKGPFAGKETVQVYVSCAGAKKKSPARELKAFTKVSLRVGETQEISIPLEKNAFSQWDSERRCWAVTKGVYEIELGRSANEMITKTTIYK
ncbi:hypothetical protein N7481_000353 [Penicillium waksmanii]|uniref:uncharacterized protein n=1 Tax=Penicillium waksmanii TaxID=69791 RepID=UPI002546F626|nr:uncharacterized protein N7481_000353 [Penicillium waksmanii]KAJ5999944.1 hypothetical protein N7481_000353 [Penicillium waksmanii]